MKILITGGSGFIGTNLTQFLANQNIEFCNLDIAPPKVTALNKFWINCDILDARILEEKFKSFMPTAVVHLAAETNTDPDKTMEDYRVNTEGSLNVIQAIRSINSVERIVFTSTQFVNQSAKGPQHDEDFDPHTIYGESKIIMEKHLRSADLNAVWTVIRPTNIWGPWHLRYPFEFWKILAENKYFHPGRQKVMRSYGYVGNVVHQIVSILEMPKTKINRKIYYVGDRPIDLYSWVNGFSIAQTGNQVKVLPRFFIFLLAITGDLLRLFKIKFPITLSRYRSMTTDNPAFMDKTFDELGEPKYSLQEGINETVQWLKHTHPNLVKSNL
jgi:nucleoside-diphosphate-sugar epimerase